MSGLTYPREWFCVTLHSREIEAKTFLRETRLTLASSGRTTYKKNHYEQWFPTREEAQAVIDERIARDAARAECERLAGSAPQLLAALKEVLPHIDLDGGISARRWSEINDMVEGLAPAAPSPKETNDV